MTVSDIVRECDLEIINMPHPEKEVSGVYIGDLLSWVMGNANSADVWITIMSNINTVAVATLVDVGCILLAEGVVPDEDTLTVAKSKEVNILSSKLTSYEIAKKLCGVGL